MSMTTLLTLASMFGGLVDVTPPISYTTKLDVWMIACIISVFGALAEFTTVIFLKYYLQNLPVFDLDLSFNSTSTTSRYSTTPSNKSTLPLIGTSVVHSIAWGGKDKPDNRFLGKTTNSALRRRKNSYKDRSKTKGILNSNNHTKAPAPIKATKVEEIIDDDASSDEEDILEERRIMAENIVKRIERYSVVVHFLIFLAFNIYYWNDIIICSNTNLEKFKQNSYYAKRDQ